MVSLDRRKTLKVSDEDFYFLTYTFKAPLPCVFSNTSLPQCPHRYMQVQKKKDLKIMFTDGCPLFSDFFLSHV